MKKRIFIIVGILLVVLISMVSCSAMAKMFSRSNTVNYQVDIRDLENPNVGTAVASNSIKSCVRIVSTFNVAGDSRTVSGAGFVITADGYVITNRHVVVQYVASMSSTQMNMEKTSTYNKAKTPTEIKVVFEDNTYYLAELCYFIDEEGEIDLAILKMKDVGSVTFDYLSIDQTSTVYYGQTAFTFGNPEGIGLLFTTVNVANPSMKLSSDGKYEFIMLDGNINHGNSGGVLLDGNSKVIGVVFARVESKAGSNTNAYGIGCAIKSKDLISFIKSYEDYLSIAYDEYKPKSTEEE